MVLNEQEYAKNEYEGLVMELLQSQDWDVELQYRHLDSVLLRNPSFFLNLFEEVGKIRDAATQSNDEKLIANLDLFEAKLYEYTDVIPADLPPSILGDKHLTGYCLTGQLNATIQSKWEVFTTYITTKLNQIQQEFQLPFLKWCVQMLNMNLGRHLKNGGNAHVNYGFDRKLQYIKTLIEKMPDKQLNAMPDLLNLPIQDSGLRLTTRKGAKIDLIRILNAMYELKFFTDPNGQVPPKQTVMDAFGTFLEINLSDYYKDLNQAFDTSNPELNIRIFRQLEEITKNKVLGVKT
jgi:hypothetical protein